MNFALNPFLSSFLFSSISSKVSLSPFRWPSKMSSIFTSSAGANGNVYKHKDGRGGRFTFIAQSPGLFSLSSSFAEDFPDSLQDSAVDKNEPYLIREYAKDFIYLFIYFSYIAGFSEGCDRMAVPSASRLRLSGGRVAPYRRRAARFCHSQLLFSLLSPPCSPRCQIFSLLRMLRLPTRPAKEEKTSRRGKRLEVQRFKSLTQNKRKVTECDGQLKRKHTYFLLWEHLAVWLSYLFVLSGTGKKLKLLCNQRLGLIS